MANENILTYLRENKERYPIEVLRKKLVGAGYPQNQVEEGIRIVYGGEAPSPPKIGPKHSFWDFKNVRTYYSTGEKILDALFGFFIVSSVVNFILGSFLRIIFGYGGYYGGYGLFNISQLVLWGIQIGAVIYFWRRRRYLAYGLAASLVLGVLFGGMAYYLLNTFSFY